MGYYIIPIVPSIMNIIYMYARPCSIKLRAQFPKSCKISVEFCASFFCLSFANVKIFLNNLNRTSSLWILPGKDVYCNVSILTLLVYIFSEYFYFFCLRFHYNKLEEANFSLPILETTSRVFVQLLLDWLWCVRIIKAFVYLHRASWDLIVVNRK